MWIKTESMHYIFHYQEGCLVEKEIHKIAELQENCYRHIARVLMVEPQLKLQYYLCNSAEQVGELYGDNEPCNGFAQMPDTIYAVYNSKVRCVGYHEDVHLISYNTLARPRQAFVREGLAMYFDRVWYGIPNQAWVQILIAEGKCPAISEIVCNEEFFEYCDSITYPLAGAFTEYIITVFGVERYKVFYASVGDELTLNFNTIFGVSLERVQETFTTYLGTFHFDEIIYHAVEMHFRDKKVL